jgi:undecaprenyl-diphosphatase
MEVIRRLKAALAWLSQKDLRLQLELLAFAGLAWMFFAIADAVKENETKSIDEVILLALRADPAGKDPVGPPWLEYAMRDLSALGGGPVATLITVLVVGYLLIDRKPRLAIMLSVCALGTWAVMAAFKDLYARGRPVLIEPMYGAAGFAFPSGHASIAAALYVTLGFLIASHLPRRALRLYVIGVGAFLALLVGFTRVYIGVHYPSDVVAGWTVGLAWALLCGLVSRRLQRRGVVET